MSADQTRPAMDIPTHDEDAVPRLQKGASQGPEKGGPVEQNGGPIRPFDAPYISARLEDG